MTDLGVSSKDIKTSLPLACDCVCTAGRHQQVVNVIVQQVSLQILGTPETAQTVQVLHSTHRHSMTSADIHASRTSEQSSYVSCAFGALNSEAVGWASGL